MDPSKPIEKPSAKESTAVKRARRKLKKRFEEQDERTSAKALELMKKAIRTWITRHSGDRIPLEERTAALYDSNQHPAKTKSKFVEDLLLKVVYETEESHKRTDLIGRIKR